MKKTVLSVLAMVLIIMNTAFFASCGNDGDIHTERKGLTVNEQLELSHKAKSVTDTYESGTMQTDTDTHESDSTQAQTYETASESLFENESDTSENDTIEAVTSVPEASAELNTVQEITEPAEYATDAPDTVSETATVSANDTSEESYQVSYVLNTNTKKFHYPNCSSVNKMKAENRADFKGTREEAIAAGYDPCGKCKP